MDRFFELLETLGIPRPWVIQLGGPIIIVVLVSAVYLALSAMHVPHPWALAAAIVLVVGTTWIAASSKFLEWFEKILGLSHRQTLMWSQIVILVLFGCAIFFILIAMGRPPWVALTVGAMVPVIVWLAWWPKEISIQRIRWGGCLVFTLFVFSLVLWSQWLQSRLPEPTAPGKIGVWIAEFSGDTTGQQVRLINEIETFIKEEVDLRDLVEVRNLRRPVLGETGDEEFETAQRLGKQVNATLVLFGDVTERFVYPKIAIIEYPQLVFSRTELRVSSIELDKITDIPAIDVKKTTLLVQFLGGIVYYMKADYFRANALFETVLKQFEQVEEAIVPGSLHVLVGNSTFHLSLQSADPQPLLKRAFSSYQKGLMTKDPRLLAATHNGLGLCYRHLAEYEESRKNLKLAIASYQEALRFWPVDADRLVYAAIWNNLGVAHEKLAKYEEPVANLKRASDAYQEALRYLTPDAQPLWYALTQNNWGVAHEKLANHEEPTTNLKQAIDAYKKALHYCPSDADPYRACYIAIQDNLGVAYSKLAEHEEFAANVRRAIDAHREALRYQSPKATPLGYALTRYNLALAYRKLAQKSDYDTNLSKAICSLACALVIWDEAGSLNARIAATDLIELRELLGIDQFQLILRSQPKEDLCWVDPSEVLTLMWQWSESQ